MSMDVTPLDVSSHPTTYSHKFVAVFCQVHWR